VLIGFVIYRDLTFSRVAEGLVGAAETTGTIIMILLFSFMISRILAIERIPQDLSELISTLVSDPLAVLITINIFLIIVGALMDDVSVTVIIAPLFMPLMVGAGVEPVHYASIVACSVVIGANSPPVAPILYMACRVGNVPVQQAIKPALMFIGVVGMPVMLLTTFVPELSLYIPRLLGFI